MPPTANQWPRDTAVHHPPPTRRVLVNCVGEVVSCEGEACTCAQGTCNQGARGRLARVHGGPYQGGRRGRLLGPMGDSAHRAHTRAHRGPTHTCAAHFTPPSPPPRIRPPSPPAPFPPLSRARGGISLVSHAPPPPHTHTQLVKKDTGRLESPTAREAAYLAGGVLAPRLAAAAKARELNEAFFRALLRGLPPDDGGGTLTAGLATAGQSMSGVAAVEASPPLAIVHHPGIKVAVPKRTRTLAPARAHAFARTHSVP